MAFKQLRLWRILSVFLLVTIGSMVSAKTIAGKTEVKLTPANLLLAADQKGTVEANLETTVKIIGADLVIKFDPLALIVDKIEPGKFWISPQILVNRIDNATGKAYLSVLAYPAAGGNGSIAILTIRQKVGQGSSLSLDNQTIIAGEGGTKISYTAQGATVSLVNAPSPILTATPTLSPTISLVGPSPTATIYPTTGASTEIGATVQSTPSGETEVGPTIILEQTPTPIPVKTKASTGFTLQLIALFLLVFGTLAFFTFKKNF